MSLTALCYNWGFFTLLAYTPFPMHLGIHELGYVFTGWGILVAIFAVFVAPRAQRRFGTPKSLYVNLALLAVDLVVIAAFTTSQITLIVAVIVSGAFVGLNNTLTTQSVMLVAPVERPIASAAYGFVRFIGGGLAPYCAARLAAAFNVHVPFYLGAVTVVIAIVILSTGHSLLTQAERKLAEPQGIAETDEPRSRGPAGRRRRAGNRGSLGRGGAAPIVVAVGVGSGAAEVTDAAVSSRPGARRADRGAARAGDRRRGRPGGRCGDRRRGQNDHRGHRAADFARPGSRRTGTCCAWSAITAPAGSGSPTSPPAGSARMIIIGSPTDGAVGRALRCQPDQPAHPARPLRGAHRPGIPPSARSRTPSSGRPEAAHPARRSQEPALRDDLSRVPVMITTYMPEMPVPY